MDKTKTPPSAQGDGSTSGTGGDPSTQKIGPVLEVPTNGQAPTEDKRTPEEKQLGMLPTKQTPGQPGGATGQVPPGEKRTPDGQLTTLPTTPQGAQQPGQGQQAVNGPVMRPGQPIPEETPLEKFGKDMGDTWTPNVADLGWAVPGGIAGYVGGAQSEATKLSGQGKDLTGVADTYQRMANNPDNPADARISAAKQAELHEQFAFEKDLAAQKTLGPTKLLSETARTGFTANPLDNPPQSFVSEAAKSAGKPLSELGLGAKVAKNVPYVGAGLTAMQTIRDGASGEKSWVRAIAEGVGSIGGGALAGVGAGALTSFTGPGAVAFGVAAGAAGGYAGGKAGTMAVDGINELFGTTY